MKNNRTRILSEVLSLDAWHDPIVMKPDSAAVYVEITFKEGRVGGDDPNIPFTFRISLKKALLTIKVEQPLQIDRSSIARSIPDTQVEHTKIREAKSLAEKSLIGKAKLSPSALHVALGGSGKSEKATSHQDQLRIVQSIPETLVTPRPEGNGAYAWELEPSFNPTLKHQPWHPVDSPRLRIWHNGKIDKIPPSVSVEVSCALEDIEIEDLEIKDKNLSNSLSRLIKRDVTRAAAIQHLKIILRDADLEPNEMDDRFSNLIIASVIAIGQ